MQDKPRVFTVEQVAKELGVSRNLIYRQVKSGVIPSVKVGDRYLIPVLAFERWLLEIQPQYTTLPVNNTPSFENKRKD
jgi:excisionase family DNA binding protein